jgi:hypothetical protein
MRDLFAELPSLAGRGFVAKQGIGTSDNFRFLRLRWEMSTDIEPPPNWRRYAKGGAYSPFFSDSNLLVNWGADGHEIKAYSAQLYGSWSKQITNTQYFGSMGLTYASRTHREFAPALLPPDSAFDTKGCCIFSSTSRTAGDWFCLLGYLNSRCFSALLRVGLSRVSYGLARQYTESLVTSVPIPDLRSNSLLEHEVQSAIALHKEIESSRETATKFGIALWIDAIKDKGVPKAIDFLHQQLKTTWEKQVKVAARIDSVSTDAYFGPAPANEITSFLDTEIGVVPTQNSEALSSGFWNVVRSSAYFDQRSSDAIERQRIAARLISVLFGCALGRWPRRPGVVDDQTPTLPAGRFSILSDDAGKDHDVIDVIELFIANLIGERNQRRFEASALWHILKISILDTLYENTSSKTISMIILWTNVKLRFIGRSQPRLRVTLYGYISTHLPRTRCFGSRTNMWRQSLITKGASFKLYVLKLVNSQPQLSVRQLRHRSACSKKFALCLKM